MLNLLSKVVIALGVVNAAYLNASQPLFNALGMNGDARDGKWPLLDEYLHHMKAAIAKASLEGGL